MTTPNVASHVDDVKTPEPVTSPEAEELVAAGATPVQADVNAIIAQLQAQMAAQDEQIKALLAERGIPSDPVAAGVLDLIAHVEARQAQYPQFDFSELTDVLKSLPDQPSDKDTALVNTVVEDILQAARHLEVEYLGVLARTLHKNVLKAGK
jgi:GTP cyclohydrolase III